jgi:hypothetical protein
MQQVVMSILLRGAMHQVVFSILFINESRNAKGSHVYCILLRGAMQQVVISILLRGAIQQVVMSIFFMRGALHQVDTSTF